MPHPLGENGHEVPGARCAEEGWFLRPSSWFLGPGGCALRHLEGFDGMEGCQGTSLNKQGTTWADSCLVMRSCCVDATLLMGKSNRWTIKFARRLIACQAAQLHLVQLFEALVQQDWHDPNAKWFPNMGVPPKSSIYRWDVHGFSLFSHIHFIILGYPHDVKPPYNEDQLTVTLW